MSESNSLLGFRFSRVKRVRRERWFWIQMSVGFGRRGFYVQR